MQVEVAKHLVRVTAVTDNGERIHAVDRGNQVLTISGQDLEFAEGDLIYIFEGNQGARLELAPPGVWSEEPWIGTVQLVGDGLTVVHGARGSVSVKTNPALQLRIGNTVRVSDVSGVIDVISPDPLPRVEGEDQTPVERFRREPDPDGQDFSAFAGAPSVLTRARELVELPLTRHELFEKIHARPIKGVLFSGPSGTGKTMLARIIANHAGAVFYDIQAPEISNKWFGQSERILRDVFDDARAQKKPAIIFFDEIDAIAAARKDDSHEASRRIVAQLLSLMDGFVPSDNVLVIATTNRPQDLDAALLRPGRFDWKVEFELPDGNQRAQVLQASKAGISTSGDIAFDDAAAQTEGWSGAELTAIWSEAQILAVKDGRSEINAEDFEAGLQRVRQNRLQNGDAQ